MKLGADADADNLLFNALLGPVVAVELGAVAPWAHPVEGVVSTRWDRGPGRDPDAPDLSRTGTSATWGLGLDGGRAFDSPVEEYPWPSSSEVGSSTSES